MVKEYQKEDITIVWKSEKCIHCGNCARGIAAVFKPREKPWIQPDGASKDEIIEQVANCPSGALSIK
jgi:uncharacterized Fe-S cluster protein YjdI